MKTNVALKTVSSVLAVLASSSAVLVGRDWAAYATGGYTWQSGAYVPDFSETACKVAYGALVFTCVVNWYARPWAGLGSVVLIVGWVLAASELAREIDKDTMPGPAIWLGWGSVIAACWGVAQERSSA